MISYKYFEGDGSSYWYSNADRDYQGLPGSFSCLLEGRIMLYKHWPFTFLVLAQLGSPTGMSPRSICFLDADSPPPRQSWHNLFLSVDFSDHWGWINFSLIHALIYCIYIFSYVLLSQVIIYVFVSIAKLLGHYSTFLYLLWKLQYRTESDTLEVLNKCSQNEQNTYFHFTVNVCRGFMAGQRLLCWLKVKTVGGSGPPDTYYQVPLCQVLSMVLWTQGCFFWIWD